MPLPNRNNANIAQRSPNPSPSIQPQVFNISKGLSTPIKQVGLATQTGQPYAVGSINGDTARAQTIVGGNDIAVSTKDGKTTIDYTGPIGIQSINGDPTHAQTMVSGGGCTITTAGGVTTVSVP